MRTALEKDSDNVPALAALGKSYLIGGGDPADGLVASARAVSLRPSRIDILQDLACLLVKARLRPRAKKPESVFYAEQWVVLAEIARAHELMANDDREGALADDGRFDEALAILDGLLESCTSEDLCDHWKRTATTLRERAEQALFAGRDNHAIQLANSGDSGQAIEVLRELEQSVSDAERLAKIRETLKLLGTR